MNATNFVEWEISEELEGSRIDYFLKKKIPSLSYPNICRLLRKGLIRVNGKRAKNSCIINTGDTVKLTRNIEIKEKEKEKKYFNEKFLKITRSWIIYKDNNIIAINKPSGIAVQGGTNIKLNVDSILDNLKFSYKERPKLVHRLDKQTSGLLLLSRNLRTAKFLSNLFKNRMISKKYLAIVNGVPTKKSGKMSIPIIQKNKELSATTFYKVIDYNREFSFLAIEPHTGRKHQIRKHFFISNIPILGETKFLKKNKKYREEKIPLFLHAYQLDFFDENKTKLSLQADLPDYFKKKMIDLKLNYSLLLKEES